MDEEALLHRISVEANVNIEFLKDLYRDEKFWSLLKKGKEIDATMHVRSLNPAIGLHECQMITRAFAAELKVIRTLEIFRKP